VLVGSEADGEGMWSARSRAGELALLRIPLASLGDGTTAAGPEDYRALPAVDINEYGLQNRFIGDWLVYGSGNPWSLRPGATTPSAHAVLFADMQARVHEVPLKHWVDRIDAMGRDAIVVGQKDEDLLFTSLRLGERAVPVSTYAQRNAAQGDERTHGFFYRPRGDSEGIVGLPVLQFDDEGASNSATVLYLRNRNLRLGNFGSLNARGNRGVEDNCQASCVDWYGNARPIFIGNRVFALLGYELVEASVSDAGITERRRVDFAPASPAISQ
jgi:hypothetical protein